MGNEARCLGLIGGLGPGATVHYYRELITALVFIAGACLAISLGAALYHLLPLALYVFVAALLVAIIFTLAFHLHLAHWYFNQGGRKDHEAGA